MVYRYFVITLLLFFSSLSVAANTPTKQPFVVGGVDSSITDTPWQVYIRVKAGSKTYACGGSIIADKWVVTAAHCLNVNEDRNCYTKANASDVSVYSGGVNISNLSSFTQHAVDNVIVNESYNFSAISNDIALLSLNTAISSPAASIERLTAAKQVDADIEFATGLKDNLLLSGWGYTTANRQNLSSQLQKVDVTGVTDSSCASSWNSTNRSDFNTLYVCANDTNQGACNGDSGGPLVWQDKSAASDPDKGYRLAGITSFGSPAQCANNALPDVYTQVSSHDAWIQATMTNCAASGSCANSATLGGGCSTSSGGGSSGSTSPLFILLLLSFYVYRQVLNHKTSI